MNEQTSLIGPRGTYNRQLLQLTQQVVHVMKHTSPRRITFLYYMAYHMHTRTLPDPRTNAGRRQTLLIRS